MLNSEKYNKTRALDLDPLTAEEIAGIEEALEDIKAGRVHSEEEIMKEFGVE